MALLYAGDPDKGQLLIKTLRSFAMPVGTHVGVRPYVAWQKAFAPPLTAGARNYGKSEVA